MKLRIVEWLLLVYLTAVLVAVFFIHRNFLLTTSNSNTRSVGIGPHQLEDRRNNRNKLFNTFYLMNEGEKPLSEASHDHRPLVDAYITFESDDEKRYWNQWAPVNRRPKNFSVSYNLKPRISNRIDHVVDIWSNNGLGDYLWEHLLQGELRLRPDNLYKHGEKTINAVKYRYKGGDNLNVGFLPDAVENVILVLNGRSNSTVLVTRSWLDELNELEALQNVGLVLIGDELCDNSWMLPYLHQKNSSSPRFVFMVYDSPFIDDKTINQFPLGVATYRKFPLPFFPDLVVVGNRKYVCNFMGTVYPNSSREGLVKVIKSVNTGHTRCYLLPREQWQPEETEGGLSLYLKVIKSSDLTLCPVGMNSESYRIYEAMSVGSVPVIEDTVVNSNCSATPYRLLRKYKAPVIFIKHWTQLPKIIANEEKMSLADKERRRTVLLGWYKSFRKQISQQFTSTVEHKFFGA